MNPALPSVPLRPDHLARQLDLLRLDLQQLQSVPLRPEPPVVPWDPLRPVPPVDPWDPLRPRFLGILLGLSVLVFLVYQLVLYFLGPLDPPLAL